MPIFKVSMKCQLENVTDLEVPDTDYEYGFKIKCNSCNEVCEKWQMASASDVVEIPGSRGTCNFMMKCKLCSRPNSLDILTQYQQKYTMDDVPSFKDIIAFECRGSTIVDFKFGNGWKCKGAETSEVFLEIDPQEGFCDYDEKANLPVGISEVEFKIH